MKTSRETLECRTYMAEDAMYRDSDALERKLHELEASLRNLTALIHRVLCESGRTPVQVKAHTIAEAVEAFESGFDVGEIETRAERIASLSGLIDQYERELERAEAPPPASDYHPVLEALTAAS